MIKSFETMITGDKKGWGVTGWRRQIRSIKNIVQQSDNREAAIDLVHRLGALGYLEF